MLQILMMAPLNGLMCIQQPFESFKPLVHIGIFTCEGDDFTFHSTFQCIIFRFQRLDHRKSDTVGIDCGDVRSSEPNWKAAWKS